jgi:hypothetical protein
VVLRSLLVEVIQDVLGVPAVPAHHATAIEPPYQCS